MRKEFEMDYGNGIEIEEFDVDYMVLFGTYDNEHPELHYNNRRSKKQIYDTVEEVKEKAEGYSNAKIWEVAHAIDSGDIVFISEVR